MYVNEIVMKREIIIKNSFFILCKCYFTMTMQKVLLSINNVNVFVNHGHGKSDDVQMMYYANDYTE